MSTPGITTNTPSSISTTYGTANGTISSVGGLTATRRGFCYKAGAGTPTTADSTVYENGTFSAGAYSLSITGLTQGTIYSIRAYMIVNATTYYGTATTLTTYPDIPTNFALVATDTEITLTWDDVDHADSYNIYWGNSSGITTSSTSFQGALSPYIHTSLTTGQTYYYKVSAKTNGLESALSVELSSLFTGSSTYPTFDPQNWEDTAYYVGLLTSEYQMATNFKAWLEHNVDVVKDGMTAANQLNNDFDIDFATGDQLDIIGDILGQSRTLTFQPTDGTEPILEDEMYRKVLKAKVVLNHWDGQLYSIEQKWNSIFPDTQIVIVDNQDMSITVSVSGDISTLIQDMIKNDMIIPRPQAVKVNYLWETTVTKKFCYDMSTVEFGGYDEANWATE